MESSAKTELRKDLMAKGLDLFTDDLRIKKDKHYQAVVQHVSDDQRYIHMNDDGSLVTMVNFPYEQFRFVVNTPNGSVTEAIKTMQSGIETVKGNGKVTFGMLSTKSWLCCNLNNLGGFQIRLTLNMPEGAELDAWFTEIQQLFMAKFTQSKLFLQRSKSNPCQFYINSVFQLGKKATQHILGVTAAAKECIGLYITKHMPAEKLASMQAEHSKKIMDVLQKELEGSGDLVGAGDSLVAMNLIAENSLLSDYQKQDPDYKAGPVDIEKVKAALEAYLNPK